MKSGTKETKAVRYEADLQAYAEDLCKLYGIEYIRIPDKFFKWVNVNCKMPARCWINSIFGSIPDMVLFVPVSDFCVTINVELKSKKGTMRKGQKEASQKLPWIVVRTIEEFEAVINRLKSIQGILKDSEALK